MAENNDQTTPSVEDLKWWADRYNLTHPVLADANYEVAMRYIREADDFSGNIGLPNMQLLAPGLKVQMSNTQLQKQQVESYLPD